MFEKLDELIELNLRKVNESVNHSTFYLNFIDLDKKGLKQGLKLAQMMENEGLIELNNQRCSLTKFGFRVSESGGWIQFNQLLAEENKIEKDKQQKKESLEFELAESNIVANKLNQNNAKTNKFIAWVGIIVGVINLIVFVYQVFSKE